jgi:type IV pilus assembly protein PilA
MTTNIQKALATRRGALGNGDEGFTLIELLVVVIVIGILAAIAIPVYLGAQNSSRDASVRSDLANIKLAVAAYHLQNDMVTAAPPLNGTTLSRYGYTQGASYTTTPTYGSGSSSTLFCVWATGTSGTTFSVSSNSGTVKGACPADSSSW